MTPKNRKSTRDRKATAFSPNANHDHEPHRTGKDNLIHYAHSLPGRPVDEWEPLADHLERVAEIATQFAAAFGAADWGRAAGLLQELLPVMVEVMIKTGVGEDWGEVCFPPTG